MRSMADEHNKMFSSLGTPSEEEIQASARDDARTFIVLFPRQDGCGLQERHKHSGETTDSLFGRKLRVSPSKTCICRTSAPHTESDDMVRLRDRLR